MRIHVSEAQRKQPNFEIPLALSLSLSLSSSSTSFACSRGSRLGLSLSLCVRHPAGRWASQRHLRHSWKMVHKNPVQMDPAHVAAVAPHPFWREARRSDANMELVRRIEWNQSKVSSPGLWEEVRNGYLAHAANLVRNPGVFLKSFEAIEPNSLRLQSLHDP